MTAKLLAANFRPRCSFCSGRGKRQVARLTRHGPGRRKYVPPDERPPQVIDVPCRECGGTGWHAVPRASLSRVVTFKGVWRYHQEYRDYLLVRHAAPFPVIADLKEMFQHRDGKWRIWLYFAGGWVRCPIASMDGESAWPSFVRARVALAWIRWQLSAGDDRSRRGTK